MLIRKSFKFELIPTTKQINLMTKYAGACRFVYNKALALQKENFESGNNFITYNTMASFLPKWKKESNMEWLKEPPASSLQHSLKDLDKAYKSFFSKRSNFPRFKRKGIFNNFRYPDAKTITLEENNDRILLPKLGWLRYRNSRKIIGTLRNVTISKYCNKWFVSIQTQYETIKIIANNTSAVGVDLGISRFATMSDGSYFPPLNSYKKNEKKLRRCQRRLSRKIKFSKNWKKEKLKLQKIHQNIYNSRKDFLHKTTTMISKKHALVCIEDLQVKNMSQSASGSIENPGKMVKQKKGLNKSILDQGWGEFRRQLNYKMIWRGGIMLVVPPHYTSQKCPSCGLILKENRKTQCKFLCISCNYMNNADVVGAINILERGHRLLACGE